MCIARAHRPGRSRGHGHFSCFGHGRAGTGADRQSFHQHGRAPVPSDEELETLIAQRACFAGSAAAQADNIQKERMQRFMQIVADLADNDDSRTLLAMLLDEFYQETFHAPLEQPSEKFLPVQSQAAKGNVGADKRRRKQRKKSSAEAGPQKPEPRENSQEAPVASFAPVRSEKREAGPSAPAVGQQDTAKQGEMAPADFNVGLSSIWDDPEEESVAEQPAQKRRRRRPTKTSKGDAGTGRPFPAEWFIKGKSSSRNSGRQVCANKAIVTRRLNPRKINLPEQSGRRAAKEEQPGQAQKKDFLE